jgi:nucleotide-binding universal stress UspA family protein
VHASLWQRYEHSGAAPGPLHPGGQEIGGAAAGAGDGRAGLSAPPPWSTAAEGAEGAGEGAKSVVGRATEQAARRNPDVKVLTDVVCEETESALLREARNATALVVGERGCGAVPGVLLGTVALAMAVRAPCPVVVVRGTEGSRGGVHRRVLLAAGDTASTAAAVRFAFQEAWLRHSELQALRAWRCPASQKGGRLRWPEEHVRRHERRAGQQLADTVRAAAREYPGTDVLRTVVEGPAHEVLLARSRDADLLVTGARRHHKHLGAQIGRVAHTMLHYADCPVAVVPHRA